MATDASWKSLDRRTPLPSKPFGGTLGFIAIAFGIGVLGAYAFDLHSHQCTCGHRWHHLGAFNMGDQSAHTCNKCGSTQWWKSGFGPQGDFATMPPSTGATTPQDFREVRRYALPSGSENHR